MHWITEIGNVNYLAVLGAALSSFALGIIWYSWPVFGKAWAALLGMTKEEADNTDGLGSTLVVAIVGSFITATFLAVFVNAVGANTLVEGAMLGALAGVALRFTSLAFHNGFARLPFRLTLINASHDIVQLTTMGAIVGMFG